MVVNNCDQLINCVYKLGASNKIWFQFSIISTHITLNQKHLTNQFRHTLFQFIKSYFFCSFKLLTRQFILLLVFIAEIWKKLQKGIGRKRWKCGCSNTVRICIFLCTKRISSRYQKGLLSSFNFHRCVAIVLLLFRNYRGYFCLRI